MKEKSPAFQFYPKDVLSDGNAMAMPPEAFGIYMKLLCFDWIDDGIIDDDKTLRRLGGFEFFNFQGEERGLEDWEIIISHVKPQFIPHPTKPGYITNPRLLKERAKQAENSQKAKDAANIRWADADAKPKHKKKDANALPTQCSSSASSISSSSSNNSIEREPDPIFLNLERVKLTKSVFDGLLMNNWHGNEKALREECEAANDHLLKTAEFIKGDHAAYMRSWKRKGLEFRKGGDNAIRPIIKPGPQPVGPAYKRPKEEPMPERKPESAAKFKALVAAAFPKVNA